MSHHFFPRASLRSTVLAGEAGDPESGDPIQTRVALTVRPETTTVAGVAVTVVEGMAYADGELVARTLDDAAAAAAGTVDDRGAHVDMSAAGGVVGHQETLLAGEDDNQPDLSLPADRAGGQVFAQERAPGVADDRSPGRAVEQTIRTPAGEPRGCLHVADLAPIEGGTGEKYSCPGGGIAREACAGGALEVVAFDSTAPSTPAAGRAATLGTAANYN